MVSRPLTSAPWNISQPPFLNSSRMTDDDVTGAFPVGTRARWVECSGRSSTDLVLHLRPAVVLGGVLAQGQARRLELRPQGAVPVLLDALGGRPHPDDGAEHRGDAPDHRAEVLGVRIHPLRALPGVCDVNSGKARSVVAHARSPCPVPSEFPTGTTLGRCEERDPVRRGWKLPPPAPGVRPRRTPPG